MKNNKKMSRGITLIALVVTIIILLILAGISIGMLSGDNGILGQSGNAKKQTDIAGEKEILQISAVSAMGKHKYGDVTKEKLDNELDKNIGNANYSSKLVDDGISVTFTNSGRTYIVDSDGNVEKKAPSVEITEAKVVTNSNGTGEDVIANSKIEGTDTLYISFKPTISGGSITSVTYNGNTVTSHNGVYVLEISKNGDYDFTITGSAEGKTISTPYTKNVDKYELRGGIEVGDYVTYITPARTAYKLYGSVSGYGNSSDYQELPQEYTKWRVLNKNDDGSMDLVAVVTSSNKIIYFKDALGWNNAVWALDDMCKALYEVPNSDSKKAITARSIDMEDITDYMVKNSLGKVEKIESYKSTKMSNLKVTSSYGTKNQDGTVTYTKNTWYPLLYEKQANGSDPYYSSATSEGKVATKPSSLTVEYTRYTGTIAKTDFTDYNTTTTKSGVYDALFTTGTKYWLASRCVYCNANDAIFDLCNVSSSNLSSSYLFYSRGTAYGDSYDDHVCPVVTLGSNVQVTPSTDTSSYHVNSPHTVTIPSN